MDFLKAINKPESNALGALHRLPEQLFGGLMLEWRKW
jgi:hypothetical protein